MLVYKLFLFLGWIWYSHTHHHIFLLLLQIAKVWYVNWFLLSELNWKASKGFVHILVSWHITPIVLQVDNNISEEQLPIMYYIIF
jgi:hypothetical protein